MISLNLMNLIFLIAFGSLNSIADEDLLHCISKYDAKWGRECSQCLYERETYTVYFRNVCDQTLDVKCAVQEKDLHWRSFTFLSVAPEAELSAYACKGTGKYQYWVRLSGDVEIEFPSDEQINSEPEE